VFSLIGLEKERVVDKLLGGEGKKSSYLWGEPTEGGLTILSLKDSKSSTLEYRRKGKILTS
jgi:hypothetical protein